MYQAALKLDGVTNPKEIMLKFNNNALLLYNQAGDHELTFPNTRNIAEPPSAVTPTEPSPPDTTVTLEATSGLRFRRSSAQPFDNTRS